jgi:DNA replication and repair protein RecF
LGNRLKDEVDRGVTLVGPHRDDLNIQLSNLPAKGYASHGQSWSIAIALRLAAFKSLREHDDDPILILDDVFAELDEKRRTRLISIITDVEQTLITAAVLEDIPKGLPSNQLLLEDN